MSLGTIRTVLAELPTRGSCPLCGIRLSQDNRSDEHIFAEWLQERFGLGNLKLNIPNYLDKFYRTVRIDICRRCNNEIFSRIEGQVRNALFESTTRAEFLQHVSDVTVVRWLCKILLLNSVKSNWNSDYRQLKEGRTASILPDDTVKGLSSVRLFLRALIEDKHFQCLFPISGTPYLAQRAFASTYYLEVDQRDNARYGAFDFLDLPMIPAAYVRLGHICIIMILDGGLHNKYRGHLVFPFYDHKLHPLQTLELFGRVIYDTLLLGEEFGPVEYFYKDVSRIYFMKFAVPFEPFPYRVEEYSEEHLSQVVSRLTMENPEELFDRSLGQMRTKLYGPDGEIWTYPVTDGEVAAAAQKPGVRFHNDTGVKWRRREWMPEG